MDEQSKAADSLWVERTGPRTYTGYSGRGAKVDMGPQEAGAVFTPGELLKVALAGCGGMSSDRAIARRLGDDYRVTIKIEGAKHDVEDRYTSLSDIFELDLSALDDDARAQLIEVALRAIDASCTVGNTLKAGAQVSTRFEG